MYRFDANSEPTESTANGEEWFCVNPDDEVTFRCCGIVNSTLNADTGEYEGFDIDGVEGDDTLNLCFDA